MYHLQKKVSLVVGCCPAVGDSKADQGGDVPRWEFCKGTLKSVCLSPGPDVGTADCGPWSQRVLLALEIPELGTAARAHTYVSSD